MKVFIVAKRGWGGSFIEVSGTYTELTQANDMANKFKDSLSENQKREGTIWFSVIGPLDVEVPERESL